MSIEYTYSNSHANIIYYYNVYMHSLIQKYILKCQINNASLPLSFSSISIFVLMNKELNCNNRWSTFHVIIKNC